MSNFWQNIPKPFTVLAPMDDVTDTVFRQIILETGRPDVFFTEFTNADGLVHGANGIPIRKLKFTPKEHPIVAQIWGTDPEHMEEAAVIAKKLGFDGIDINMGCAVRDIIKRGAGSALIGNYELSKKIIDAVKRGAGDVPVSVKTRLGRGENIAKEWTTFLLGENLAALTIHARLAKQMSKGEADWDEIAKIVEIRNKIAPETLIIGNGDVKNYAEVFEKAEKYNVDGVMIGRGVFANPWVFNKNQTDHPKEDYINLLLAHMDLFEKTWGDAKNYAVLKKFFKMYIKDFKGANQLRIKLMETNSFGEARKVLSI